MIISGRTWPLFFLFTCAFRLYAQDPAVSTVDSLNKEYLNWHILDPGFDKVQGAAVSSAYRVLLRNTKPKKKIVVAIIDSGVDIEHEDLKGKIWKNKAEIPGNKTDDDQNGYTDDLHGWNFLGNSSGENIEYENYEQVRIVRKYEEQFKNIPSADQLPEAQQAAFKMYVQSKKWLDEELAQYQQGKLNVEVFEKNLHSAEKTIKEFLKKETITQQDIRSVASSSPEVSNARDYLLNLYKKGYNPAVLGQMKEQISLFLDFHLNINYNPRKIIGDNPEDISDRKYGNNDVKGPRSDHGTFVAGIVAAKRDNSIGIDGIADSVEIMALRAVPWGDERDKDIALAIRYATDHGANIINMSFGKNFSPEKKFVDEAIQYAEDHNVLMVHAAGNHAENIDLTERYPTNRLDNGAVIGNWITVGASSKKPGKELPAAFSNYGKENVDLFAPGVNIISLHPDNSYKTGEGTSYASPVVSGVAALVWSYYPALTAAQLKKILLQSVTRHPKEKVYLPDISGEERTETKFSELSKTGGIVNAYQALKLAEKIGGE